MTEKLRTRRKTKHTYGKMAIVTATVAVVLIISVIVVMNSIFAASEINVQNSTRYDSAVLLADIGFSIEDSVFSVDRDKLINEIPKRFPYVASATVDTVFPAEITFSFEANYPLFSFESEGKYIYLDKNLKVLEITDEPDSELIFIYGITVEEPVLGQSLDLNDNIELTVLKSLFDELKANEWADDVDYIDFSKLYNIRFSVYGIITVQLGNSEKLREKVAEAKYIYGINDPERKADINVKNYPVCRYDISE